MMWSEGECGAREDERGEMWSVENCSSQESQKEHVAGQDELPAPQKIFRYLGSHLLPFHETYCDR